MRQAPSDDEVAFAGSAGKSHHGALRVLGNRWLEILWHCLSNGVRYDEDVHVANRNRALARAA